MLAAALLVVGTLAVTDRSPAVAPQTGVPVLLTPVADAPVDAELRLQAVAWGTRITMTCRYEGPGAAGPYDEGPWGTYQLVVVSAADRSTRNVASWQVLPGREAVVAGSTELFPEQIAEVQLRDSAGTVLVAGSPSR